MRVTITVAAANDPEAHRWLDRIVNRIEDRWHVWDTTELEDPATMMSSSWFRDPGRQGRRLRELLCHSVERGAWSFAPHGRRVRVTSVPHGSDEFRPQAAFRLADTPLTVLVENSTSDGAFLERVVRELDPSLHKLWRAEVTPIRVEGAGGGGEMPKEVKRRITGSRDSPRLVVVRDSDKKVPNSEDSAEVKTLRRICQQQGVTLWVLAKRAAENYLPRVLLDARPDVGLEHTGKVAAWDRLTEDQKDYFDMKNGLGSDLSLPEEALFANISTEDRTMLTNGFGDRLYACWSVWSVQARHELRVRSRCDLERGLALIRSQL